MKSIDRWKTAECEKGKGKLETEGGRKGAREWETEWEKNEGEKVGRCRTGEQKREKGI